MRISDWSSDVFSSDLSPGTILLGVGLGLLVGRVFRLLRPPRVHVRNYPLAARLLMRVVFDIVRSNLIVARLILRGDGGVRSGFVAIPLTLTSHHGLAVLGCIITSTPGTIWVSYDPIRSLPLIPILDRVNYQSPLP